MYLVIDIANFQGFELGLYERINSPSFFDKKKYDLSGDRILGSIKNLLAKNKLTIDDLRGIAMTHSGSFTAERTVAVIVNAIGYAKNIPVVAFGEGEDPLEKIKSQKKFVPVKPVYSRPPNITAPKKELV